MAETKTEKEIKKESITLYDVSAELLIKISEAKRSIMEKDPLKRNVTNTEAIEFLVLPQTAE